MTTPHNNLFYHFVAFVTVAIWGTTFVSTKVLILNGLTPAQIFTMRFVMAYLLLLAVCHRQLWSNSWRDEAIMAALGMTGGSLYFLSENEALRFTTATNTSLIVCSCPLVATLVIGAFYKNEIFKPVQVLGSLIALAGMAVVVLNGRFVLKLSPLGDALAFGACLCWALYSLLMKGISARYSSMFVTRKVFFYGVLTILPYYIFFPGMPAAEVLARPAVWGNLLFLGGIASMVCYVSWNWCIARLGTVRATNWVYCNPLSTMVFAWWVLHETITPFFIIGATLILSGMYLCDKKR